MQHQRYCFVTHISTSTLHATQEHVEYMNEQQRQRKRNAVKNLCLRTVAGPFKALYIKPFYFQVKFTIEYSERTREKKTGTRRLVSDMSPSITLLYNKFSVGP